MSVMLFIVRFILVVLIGIALWIFKVGLFLVFIGILPTIVAWFVDKEQDKNAAKIVGYMNCLGLVIVEGKIFCSGSDWMAASWKAIENPINLIIMYSSALIGWIFVFFMPRLVRSYFAMFYDRILIALVKERLRLLKQWGNEIKLGPSILLEREREIVATVHYIRSSNIFKKQKKFFNSLSDDTKTKIITQSLE